MSTRTRRVAEPGNDGGPTSSSSTLQIPAIKSTTTSQGRAALNQSINLGPAHNQRKRRLDVDSDNIIATDPAGGRLKRRRSPSVPLPDQTAGATRRGSGAGGSAENEIEKREEARIKGTEIYDHVMYEQDADGRFLASEFIGLPNRRQFPDYYNLIKHPMSLSVMQEKLAKTGKTAGEAGFPASTGGGLKLKLKIGGASASAGVPASQQTGNGQALGVADDKYEGYRDLDEVKRDFDLIWGNAKRYNQKESGIFKDAQRLHKLTKSLYQDALAHPEPTHEPETVVVVNQTPATIEPKQEEIEKDKPRPTKKVKISSINKIGTNGHKEADSTDVQMADVAVERDVGKLIKGGLKELEGSVGGSPPRLICHFFHTLPSKKDYPDYYLFIKSPISLKEIRTKAEKNKYDSLEAWENDIKLMCANARFYNEERSIVHEDAAAVEKATSGIVQDAYRKLGIPPPIAETIAPAGPKLKFNVKPAETPSTPLPTSAPPPTPAMTVPVSNVAPAALGGPPATPRIQLKTSTSHNEKLRTPALPRLPSGNRADIPAQSPGPPVTQKASDPSLNMSNSQFNSSAVPPIANAVTPSTTATAIPAAPVPKASAAPTPAMQRNGQSGETPSRPSPAPVSTPLGRISFNQSMTGMRPSPMIPSARPMGPPPTMSTQHQPLARPNSMFAPVSVASMHPMTPQMQPRIPPPAMTPASVPRPSPAPAMPRPQVPMIPLVRRPLPSLPILKRLDFAYDVLTRATVQDDAKANSKRMKLVQLRNLRGVTNHTATIRQETTRLEIVAHLGEIGEKPPANDAMEVEGAPKPIPPASITPHFSLRYEGRRISGTTVPAEGETLPGGRVSGCKWDVPVTSRSALSTIEITVERPQDKALGVKPKRPETYLIFINRQS